MSKIFKIAGRYNENRFSFSAEIAVDNDGGAFCGRCGYVTNPDFSLKPHFVVGVLIEDGGITGTAFYMLSNDAKTGPLEFIAPNIEETGKCGVGVLDFDSISESEANISLKGSESFLKDVNLVDEEAHIRESFNEINKSLYSDDKILTMQWQCRIALQKAQAKYKMERGD